MIKAPRNLLQAAWLQAIVERARRRVHELIAEAVAEPALSERNLTKAQRYQEQAAAAVAELEALAHDEEAARLN
jgi:hypothetical protein